MINVITHVGNYYGDSLSSFFSSLLSLSFLFLKKKKTRSKAFKIQFHFIKNFQWLKNFSVTRIAKYFRMEGNTPRF